MSKKLFLDSAVVPEFRWFVHGGLGLGIHLQDRIVGGEFYVWVPDEFTSIDQTRFQQDIFSPIRFNVDPARMQAISEFLDSEPNGVVIADTSREVSEPRLERFRLLEWFSVRNPAINKTYLCVFLRKEQFNAESYRALMAESSAYTTTLTLTSVTSPERLVSGMDLNTHPDVLQELLDRVKQVMVGVFDEMSMLVWHRTQFGRPCPPPHAVSQGSRPDKPPRSPCSRSLRTTERAIAPTENGTLFRRDQ